jgi:hypothetical protein
LARNWVRLPSESRLPDTGFDAPESLTPADGGKDVVEIDTTGNVIIRNSATGVVERQVAGPIKGIATGDNSQYAAALDPEAKYAAVNVSQADNGYPTDNVDIIDMATGAITRLPGGAAIGVAYDGEQLLIQRASGTFEVRSADGRQLIRSFAGDGDATAGPVVNGAGLAVEVNPNGTAPVFDVASGQQIGLLTLPVGPRSVSTSVAFAANGQLLDRGRLLHRRAHPDQRRVARVRRRRGTGPTEPAGLLTRLDLCDGRDSPNVYIEIGAARAAEVPVVHDYATDAELAARAVRLSHPYRRALQM